ncbi:MBL fold metallo-hydrolase [Mariniblastus sp.]|nr:MBL fold metallo-hydrolase [Mariniblastus sp.]MDB4756152.1 MBL fold metallo-hydrolase [Mariniblastus sp.]
MVNNVGLKKIEFDGYTIEGYSRAAVQTCWRIPELKLGFDLGAQPWEFMGTPVWFVSHMHLDHCAALPVYVARRRMMKMDPPVIYLPKKSVDPFYAILKLFSSLDRGRLPVELIGIEPGEEIELSRELVVTTAKAFHTVPAMSFLVWDRRKKLRPEFADLPGDQLRNLKMQGTEISREVRMPLVGYLGDSSPRGLDENPDMYLARILITEMTFLSPDHRKEIIHKNGHMHLDDYVERADRFQNEIIVAGHLSTRYNRKQAIRFVERAFPDWMNNRLNLFV